YEEYLDGVKLDVERLKTRFNKSIGNINEITEHIATYASQPGVKVDHPYLMHALNVLGLKDLQTKGELTKEDIDLINQTVAKRRNEAEDNKQILGWDEGEVERRHARLLSTYSEEQLTQWRIKVIASHMDLSQTASQADIAFVDRALTSIGRQLDEVAAWEICQPRKADPYAPLKKQLEIVRDHFDEWRRLYDWMSLELELQQHRREKKQAPKEQLSADLTKISNRFSEQMAAAAERTQDAENQEAAPGPEWWGRVVPRLGKAPWPRASLWLRGWGRIVPRLGKALAESMEINAASPEEQVDQKLSAIIEKMKMAFANPAAEGAWDRLQDLRRQARELRLETPGQKNIDSLGEAVTALRTNDPLRARSYEQRMDFFALYRSMWKKIDLLQKKENDWQIEGPTLSQLLQQRLASAGANLREMPAKHQDLMSYLLELEKPYKWDKRNIRELIGDYKKKMATTKVGTESVAHEFNPEEFGYVMPPPRLRETVRRPPNQLLNTLNDDRFKARIEHELALLNDNEFRSLDELPPMLKGVVSRLLNAKEEQSVSLNELDQRVKEQKRRLGMELLRWDREVMPLEKGKIKAEILLLEETKRVLEAEEQAQAAGMPLDAAHLRLEQAIQVEGARRTRGWSEQEQTLDDVSAWLMFDDPELQRIRNRIEADKKQAESYKAPVSLELEDAVTDLESRLDDAEACSLGESQQAVVRDFEETLQGYTPVKKQLIRTLQDKLSEFENDLKDSMDTSSVVIKDELRRFRRALEYPANENPSTVLDTVRGVISNLRDFQNQQSAIEKALLQRAHRELKSFESMWVLMVVTPFHHISSMDTERKRREQLRIDQRIPGALLSRVQESFKELRQQEKTYEEAPESEREAKWDDEWESRFEKLKTEQRTAAHREAALQDATTNKRHEIQRQLNGEIRDKARKFVRSEKRYSFEDGEKYIADQLKAAADGVKKEVERKINSVEVQQAIESAVSKELESQYGSAVRGRENKADVATCEGMMKYVEHQRRRLQVWEPLGYEFPRLKERAEYLGQRVRESREYDGNYLLESLIDDSFPELEAKWSALARTNTSIDTAVIQSLGDEFGAIKMEFARAPQLTKLETAETMQMLIQSFDRLTELGNKIDELIWEHQENLTDRARDARELVEALRKQQSAKDVAESAEDKAEIQKEIERIELLLNKQLETLRSWSRGEKESESIIDEFDKSDIPKLMQIPHDCQKTSLKGERESLEQVLTADENRRKLMVCSMPQSLTMETVVQWHDEFEAMTEERATVRERIRRLDAQLELDKEIATFENAISTLKKMWEAYPGPTQNPDPPAQPSSSSQPMDSAEMQRKIDWWSRAIVGQKEKFQQFPADSIEETPLNEIRAVLKYLRSAIETTLTDATFADVKKNYLSELNEKAEARQGRLNRVQEMMALLPSLKLYLTQDHSYAQRRQTKAVEHITSLNNGMLSKPDIPTLAEWGQKVEGDIAYVLNDGGRDRPIENLATALQPIVSLHDTIHVLEEALQPLPGAEIVLGSEFKNRTLLHKASRYIRQSSLAIIGSNAAMSYRVMEGGVQVMEEKDGGLVPGDDIRRDISAKPANTEENKALWQWLKDAGVSEATRFHWAPNEFPDGAGLKIPENTCVDYISGSKAGEPQASFLVRNPNPMVNQMLRVPANWLPKAEQENLIKKIDNLKKSIAKSSNQSGETSGNAQERSHCVRHHAIPCLNMNEQQQAKSKSNGQAPRR
ncbi:MAG TPA: hypothetical protein VM532_05575, partial [Burkholderiales bacterium]|nr:hypothetical protein [Burkholderiales bacterium]